MIAVGKTTLDPQTFLVKLPEADAKRVFKSASKMLQAGNPDFVEAALLLLSLAEDEQLEGLEGIEDEHVAEMQTFQTW